MRNWMLVGRAKNWDVAFRTRTWGFKHSYVYAQVATEISKGDRVFFYVTTPVTGVVGFGKVLGKPFRGDKPLWPSEVDQSEVIYVHRFNFRITRLLDRDLWRNKRIRLFGRAIVPGLLRSIVWIPEIDAEWIIRQTRTWRKHRGTLFLSHSHSDKRFCRRLAEDLRNKGIFVWMDEAEIQVGDSLIRKISKAIDEMDYAAVVLSKSSVKSSWVKKEVDIAMTREIRGKRVKVLPILLESCQIPLFLKDKVYADFRDASKYKKELTRIVNRIAGALAT